MTRPNGHNALQGWAQLTGGVGRVEHIIYLPPHRCSIRSRALQEQTSFLESNLIAHNSLSVAAHEINCNVWFCHWTERLSRTWLPGQFLQTPQLLCELAALLGWQILLCPPPMECEFFNSAFHRR